MCMHTSVQFQEYLCTVLPLAGWVCDFNSTHAFYEISVQLISYILHTTPCGDVASLFFLMIQCEREDGPPLHSYNSQELCRSLSTSSQLGKGTKYVLKCVGKFFSALIYTLSFFEVKKRAFLQFINLMQMVTYYSKEAGLEQPQLPNWKCRMVLQNHQREIGAASQLFPAEPSTIGKGPRRAPGGTLPSFVRMNKQLR